MEHKRVLFQEERIPFTDDAFKLNIQKKTLIAHSPEELAKATSRFIHPELEIKLFVSGHVGLMVGNDYILTQPNDIIIVNPFEVHSTIYKQDMECIYYLFLIGLDFLGSNNGSGLDLEALTLRKRLRFQHLIRNNPLITNLLYEIANEYLEKKAYYTSAVYGKMITLFSYLLRNEIDEKNTATFEAESMKYYSIVEPAFGEIRNNYAQPINISLLADICNVSKSHFCRIFKKVTNMTVGQYLTAYRLKVANALLESSDFSIGEISQKCGFDDQGYFGRCYKKEYGFPPSRVRDKQYQNR